MTSQLARQRIPPNTGFVLAPADIGLRTQSTASVVAARAQPRHLVFNRNHFADVPEPEPFESIAVPARANGQEVQYWIAAPVLSNGWTILGERGKVVVVSTQRIASFIANDGGNVEDAVVVELIGVAGEMVTLDFASPNITLVTHSCVFGDSASLRMTVPSGVCYPQ